jgi:hypothetical protein
MASSAPNGSLVGRAAAILTTGEVAGAALDLNRTWGGHAVVDLSFTIGSLTNVIVRFYASLDGVTYKPIAVNAAVIAETLTASAERAYVLPNMGGWKYLRVSVQGTGTVTSSSCAFTYRFQKRGSQM